MTAAFPPASDPITLTVSPAHQGRRLDVFLASSLPHFSRAQLQRWIKEGRVRVDGKPVKPSLLLAGGEAIHLQPAPPPPLHAHPEDIPLCILWEDDHLVAIDKPAGMVVHAGAGRHSGTLVNALLHRYSHLSQLGGPSRPGIVHRLDKDTSGVLLVARHDAAHRALAAQFASRQVEKIYLALVVGAPDPPQGEIRLPIARDPIRRTRMSASLGYGRAAFTRYRTLRRFSDSTLLEVSIGTGRTHQIRVHLATLGHPIVGDTLYGGRPSRLPRPLPHRFFLHAHRISFRHPLTRQPLSITSPLPPDLEAFLQALL